MPRPPAPTLPPDPWHHLLVRALDGLLPPDLTLERLLDRIEHIHRTEHGPERRA